MLSPGGPADLARPQVSPAVLENPPPPTAFGWRRRKPSAGATGRQRPVRPGDWVQGEAKGGVEDAGGQLERLVLKNEKKLGGAVGWGY